MAPESNNNTAQDLKVGKEKAVQDLKPQDDSSKGEEAPNKDANKSVLNDSKVLLKCKDGQELEVDLDAAMQSVTIKNIVEDCGLVVPLPNVTGPVMSKIIKYWNQHASEGAEYSEETMKFDKEFVKMDHVDLFEMILAANYLDCTKLLDLTCQAVADIIKDMSVEEVRDYFGIENDFTPEEEAQIRCQNAWAFQ